MSEWKEFFEGRSETWEEAYKAFFARREAEDEEKLTEIFGPLHCQCPYPYDKARDDGCCRYLDPYKEICNHPSNKPLEPECEHGETIKDKFYPYTWEHDKYCRNCGKKLR